MDLNLFSMFSQIHLKRRKSTKTLKTMMKEINEVGLFPVSNEIVDRGLINAFNKIKATPEQAFDMLHFRDIGENDLEQYINHYLLKKPSTAAPVRKKNNY